MKYTLILAQSAQEDILDSIHWYNQEKEMLGFNFLRSGKRKNDTSRNPTIIRKRN